MNEKKIRVAVLFGGVSSEHEISLMSVQSVLRNMPEDYEVLTIGITKDGRWVEYTGSIDEITDQKWEQDQNLRTAVVSPDRSHKGILLIDKDQVTVVPVDICFRFCTENMARTAPFRACSSWQEFRLLAAT